VNSTYKTSWFRAIPSFFGVLSIYVLLPSCDFWSDDFVVKIGNGNDVRVRLEFRENSGISKIQLYSESENYLLTAKELENKNTICFAFSEKGEGLVHVVVYTPIDTVLSQHYVERGFTVKLFFDNGKITTLDPTGY
jgi:hypothetical protein